MTPKTQLIEFLGRSWKSAKVQELANDFLDNLESSQVEDRLYYEFRKNGLALATDANMRVESVHAYSEGKDGFDRYEGELPSGLMMTDGAKDVRKKMGEPSKSGDAQYIPMLGRSATWDRYDFEEYSVHVEYCEGKISMITLMTRDAIPG